MTHGWWMTWETVSFDQVRHGRKRDVEVRASAVPDVARHFSLLKPGHVVAAPQEAQTAVYGGVILSAGWSCRGLRASRQRGGALEKAEWRDRRLISPGSDSVLSVRRDGAPRSGRRQEPSVKLRAIPGSRQRITLSEKRRNGGHRTAREQAAIVPRQMSVGRVNRRSSRRRPARSGAILERKGWRCSPPPQRHRRSTGSAWTAVPPRCLMLVTLTRSNGTGGKGQAAAPAPAGHAARRPARLLARPSASAVEDTEASSC